MKTLLRVLVTTVVLSALIFAGISLYGAPPERNISWKHHPNLAAAQKLIDQAWAKISRAQRANEFDMDGHAQKAKDLLEQANEEIKQSAEAANEHKH